MKPSHVNNLQPLQRASTFVPQLSHKQTQLTPRLLTATTATTPPQHELSRRCFPLIQQSVASSYYSVTRVNQGRSAEEAEKCDYIHDPTESNPELQIYRSRKNGLRIQPKKLLMAANLAKGRSIEDALLQMKFSDRRSCQLVYAALLAGQKNAAKNRGWDPNLMWVRESIIKRERIVKRLQYKGRGRFGLIKSYYTRYECVLVEGKPPLAKKIPRTFYKNIPERERKLRFPKTIKNSLDWY